MEDIVYKLIDFVLGRENMCVNEDTGLAYLDCEAIGRCWACRAFWFSLLTGWGGCGWSRFGGGARGDGFEVIVYWLACLLQGVSPALETTWERDSYLCGCRSFRVEGVLWKESEACEGGTCYDWRGAL